MIMKKNVLLAIFTTLLAACGDGGRDWCDSGYSDGYAAGYNTTCKIRTTLIEGAWDKGDYKACYNEGYAAGAQACRSSK